jgi:hypothetical protein
MSDNVKKVQLSKESSGQNNQKGSGEKRSGFDRRKFSYDYPGSDRRKGKDRRKQKDSD